MLTRPVQLKPPDGGCIEEIKAELQDKCLLMGQRLKELNTAQNKAG